MTGQAGSAGRGRAETDHINNATPRQVPVIAVALAALLALISWLRLDSTTRGTVWAEDGFFLSVRRADGPFTSIFEPYAGYLHVVPRVLVDLASLVSLERFAVTITALTCVVVGGVGGLVFLSAGRVVPDFRMRVVLGAITSLVPQAPIEVLGNAANLHYYLLWLAPWILLAKPHRRWQGLALAAVALLIALSEIQAALFLPLLLLYRRERFRWPVSGAFALGIAVQVAVTVTTPRQPSGGPARLVDVAQGYLFNVVLAMWHPSVDGPGALFAAHGWWLAGLELLPFVAALLALMVMVMRRTDSTVMTRVLREAPLVAVLVAGAVVPLVAGLTLNAGGHYPYSQTDVAQLADTRPLRYGVVSAMFLLALLVVLADRLLGLPLPGRTLIAASLVAAVLALCVTHFAVDTRRSHGPSWAAELARAKRACQDVSAPATVNVPIAPKRQGWMVTLSCQDLFGERTPRAPTVGSHS